jgi:hypothetical protein
MDSRPQNQTEGAECVEHRRCWTGDSQVVSGHSGEAKHSCSYREYNLGRPDGELYVVTELPCSLQHGRVHRDRWLVDFNLMPPIHF